MLSFSFLFFIWWPRGYKWKDVGNPQCVADPDLSRPRGGEQMRGEISAKLINKASQSNRRARSRQGCVWLAEQKEFWESRRRESDALMDHEPFSGVAH